MKPISRFPATLRPSLVQAPGSTPIPPTYVDAILPTLPIDWKAAYRAAINEHAPEKKGELCDRACDAINDRLLQMRYPSDPREIEVLIAGLRKLTLHKHTKKHKRR